MTGDNIASNIQSENRIDIFRHARTQSLPSQTLFGNLEDVFQHVIV